MHNGYVSRPVARLCQPSHFYNISGRWKKEEFLDHACSFGCSSVLSIQHCLLETIPGSAQSKLSFVWIARRSLGSFDHALHCQRTSDGSCAKNHRCTRTRKYRKNVSNQLNSFHMPSSYPNCQLWSFQVIWEQNWVDRGSCFKVWRVRGQICFLASLAAWNWLSGTHFWRLLWTLDFLELPTRAYKWTSPRWNLA